MDWGEGGGQIQIASGIKESNVSHRVKNIEHNINKISTLA